MDGEGGVGAFPRLLMKDAAATPVAASVTRFGEIPPLWQIFKKFLAIYLKGIWFWTKFSTHFATICILLGQIIML